MLLIVLGVILLGLAAGLGLATYKVRRMRGLVRQAGFDDPDPEAARATARRRLVLTGVLGLAGIALIVVGALW